jgi:Rrf2 family transcriptional repressor of oqxAB
MLDLRFPTAVQMMLSLAPAKEEGIERLSSTRLAQSLNANPSLVRTLLVPLVQDGYVASGAGRNGGVRLAKGTRTRGEPRTHGDHYDPLRPSMPAAPTAA